MTCPCAEPGTRYLVSRLTAHAARHRADLVFPLAEIRDSQGRVVGARGLGTYRRSLALAERYRDWRARSGDRRSRRSLPAQWPTGVLFAAGTALLSGALGLLPGVLDDITAQRVGGAEPGVDRLADRGVSAGGHSGPWCGGPPVAGFHAQARRARDRVCDRGAGDPLAA